MQIDRLVITGKFSHFWLKTVEGVNLSQHCAKCLLGKYDDRMVKSGELHNLALEDSVYYMCGVSEPYQWEKNFHLAFRPATGSTISMKEHGVEVVIRDAETLPISESFIDPADPNAGKDDYRACRNWQFAHYFAKNLVETQK